MKPDDFDAILRQTLDDLRLSRSEKKALRAQLKELPLGSADRIKMRQIAFSIAREYAQEHPTDVLVDWLDEVTRVLVPEASGDKTSISAHFSPGQEPRGALQAQLRRASSAVDICVFTITDNSIADEIIAAHDRGIRVRVVTDNHKAEDRGSDIERMEAAGVPIVVDITDKHMHHKFAIFDRSTVVTGSYNWTRSAAEFNQENIVVTNDPGLIRSFSAEFESLWKSFSAKS